MLFVVVLDSFGYCKGDTPTTNSSEERIVCCLLVVFAITYSAEILQIAHNLSGANLAFHCVGVFPACAFEVSP